MGKFQTIRWKYISRKPKTCFLIYARERKVADEIVAIENTDNLYVLKPARLFGKKTVSIKIPPLELEQQQIETAEIRLKKRRDYLEAHPEERQWLANH